MSLKRPDKARQHIEASITALSKIDHNQLLTVAGVIALTLREGRKVLLAGNGGSAADAQHIAAELVGRYKRDRAPWPVLALTTDTSVLTAIGNDYGFDTIFARQVSAHGRARDVFIGITTSGKSLNILNAFKAAEEQGMIRIGLTGSTPQALSQQCQYVLRAPSRLTPIIQQCHITMGHVICHLIEDTLACSQ